MISKLTGNIDSRSGGCSYLNLPADEFQWGIINSNGITLRNIIECIYRLKGSKYDYCYELFSSIQMKKTNNDKLTLKVNFNYGS